MNEKIALTFDDGPDKETPNILNILNDNGVKATFFCMGIRVRAHPDFVRRAFNEGHQIANHTFSHPKLTELTDDQTLDELRTTNDAIQCITGKTPIFFRAPYGLCNERVNKKASELGLMPHIHWDIDTKDWGYRPNGCTPVADIVDAIKNAHNGLEKVLCHDGVDLHGVGCKDRKITTDALKEAIPELKHMGYTFVTVAELNGKSSYK